MCICRGAFEDLSFLTIKEYEPRSWFGLEPITETGLMPALLSDRSSCLGQDLGADLAGDLCRSGTRLAPKSQQRL